MTDVPTATPQPEAPPVEAPAAVPQPAPAGPPPTDPRLAHLVQHYLPEGVNLETELMHVVQGVGAQGEPTFHYRPLVAPPAAPVAPTEPPPVPPAVPAPAQAPAPVATQPTPAAPSPAPVTTPPAVPGYGQQTVVASAPQAPQGLERDPSTFTQQEDFGAWWDGLLDADAQQATRQPVNL